MNYLSERLGRFTLRQVAFLRGLADNSMNHTEAAKLMGVSTAALTGMKDMLVKEGIVETRLKTGDRRMIVIILTEKGSDAVAKIEAWMRETLIEADTAV